jgi:hypothetical protein
MSNPFAVGADENPLGIRRRRAVKLRLIPVDANVVQPARFPGGLVDRCERAGARADVDRIADNCRRGEDSAACVVLPQHGRENDGQHS